MQLEILSIIQNLLSIVMIQIMQKTAKTVHGLQMEKIVWIFFLGEKLSCVMKFLDDEKICITQHLQQKVFDVKTVIISIYVYTVKIVFYAFD